MRAPVLPSLILSLILTPGVLPLRADPVCPAAPDHEAAKTDALRALRDAPDPAAAGRITADLWRLWTDAPDERAQGMLDAGMALIRSGDHSSSEVVLGDLVAYCPAYAEGWNQRAFARFLMGSFAGALEDLDQALAIDPRHVPALSGKALVLMHLGRHPEAQLVLRRAVRMNPWLSERSLLTIPMDVEL